VILALVEYGEQQSFIQHLIGISNSPDSHYHDWRARKLLNAAGPLRGHQQRKDAFFDNFGRPY